MRTLLLIGVLFVDAFAFARLTELWEPQAPFTFYGDAVAVYGAVSPFHANYSVTLDGVEYDFSGGSNGLASHRHKGVRPLSLL